MNLDNEFEKSVAVAKNLPPQTNETLLKIYSLYKQATEGDIGAEKPSNPFDFVGNAKHNAWENLRGITKDEAKKQYIELIDSLSQKSA